MSDLDKHLDTFARAVATLGVSTIPATVVLSFCEMRGFDFSHTSGRSALDLTDALIARFPVWAYMNYREGVSLKSEASAHQRMAWAAFVREVLAAEGVAS